MNSTAVAPDWRASLVAPNIFAVLSAAGIFYALFFWFP
jgi:hypothetical protein